MIFCRLNDFEELGDGSIANTGCKTDGKFAIIVHGFQENEGTEWVRELINNLLVFRGGCVLFFEYPRFTKLEYAVAIMDKFTRLSNILLRKLQQLNYEGVVSHDVPFKLKFYSYIPLFLIRKDPDNIYMFGFSLGAQLVIDVGYRFGIKRIKEIDGIFF